MSDIKALLEFSQTQPWEAEKRLEYRWSCYNKHLNFMGPEDLGTCRVTLDLCQELLTQEQASDALPLVRGVLQVFETRFDGLQAPVFEAKLLLAQALVGAGKEDLGRSVFRELSNAIEGRPDEEALRGCLEMAQGVLPVDNCVVLRPVLKR